MESKNNIRTIALVLIITAVLVGGGAYWWSQSNLVQDQVSKTSANSVYAVPLRFTHIAIATSHTRGR